MKPYDVGMICGRFQTFHKGHESLVKTGLELCDRVLILIGSAQECGTERNPLNINTRTKMLKEIYGDNSNIMIYGLADLTNENDITPDWGKYLLGNADRYIYKVPELMISGNDEERTRWFAAEDIIDMSQLIVNRGRIPISAAMELMIAKEYHIPVIALNKDGNKLHPWLVECSTRICDSMRELVEHVANFYLK